MFIQNHLLQVVGFLAMEPPTKTNHQSIRGEQVKVFRKIRPLGRGDIVRGYAPTTLLTDGKRFVIKREFAGCF